jgi:hypothetical protein
VTDARRTLSLEETDSLEWGTPVLFMRAPDGMIFQISQT